MPRFVFAGAVGAALAYFFDPDNGRKRRKEAIKRAAKPFRQAGRKAHATAGRGLGRARHTGSADTGACDALPQPILQPPDRDATAYVLHLSGAQRRHDHLDRKEARHDRPQHRLLEPRQVPVTRPGEQPLQAGRHPGRLDAAADPRCRGRSRRHHPAADPAAERAACQRGARRLDSPREPPQRSAYRDHRQ